MVLVRFLHCKVTTSHFVINKKPLEIYYDNISVYPIPFQTFNIYWLQNGDFLPSVFLLYLLVDVTILFSEGSSCFPYKYEQIKDFFKVTFKSTLKMLPYFSFNFEFSLLHAKKPRADISYCST